MNDLKKRTVVVTGGSRGIGREICLSFAGPETDIYFIYFPEDPAAKETERLVSDLDGKVKSFCIDVSSGEEVGRFFKTIKDETGRIDVLVNNAGVTKDGLLVRMKEKDWNQWKRYQSQNLFVISYIAHI